MPEPLEKTRRQRSGTRRSSFLRINPLPPSAPRHNKRLKDLIAEQNRGTIEIVVLVLGSASRFYACWKSSDGKFHQDSYNLPDKLHKWLFDKGSERDFASLQLTLGEGDEFHASDRNGKISATTSSSSKETRDKDKGEGKETQPTRALRRRTMRIADLQKHSKEKTDSHMSPEDTQKRPQTMPASRPRRQSFDVPSFFHARLGGHQNPKSPKNVAVENKDQGNKKKSPPPPSPENKQRAARGRSQSIPSGSVPNRSSSQGATFFRTNLAFKTDLSRNRNPSTYADSCTQTEPFECLCDHSDLLGHLSQSGMIATAITLKSKPSALRTTFDESNGSMLDPAPNSETSDASPVLMGTMGSYFRSGSYQLGDMLRMSYIDGIRA